jgi:hypothetical protein
VSNATTATQSGAAASPSWLGVLLVNSPYILLFIVTIWLVSATDNDAAKAGLYWQYFVPVVGLVSIIGGWAKRGESSAGYLIKQVLHWGALSLVIYLLFLEPMQQFLNAESHGFVTAYMVGLAAILSGIYLDWKMAVFGAFVVGSAVAIGYLEDNALLIVSGVAFAAVVVILVMRKLGTR